MEQSTHAQGEAFSLIGIGRETHDPNLMQYALSITKAMGLRPVLFHVSSADAPSEEGERLLANARAMLPSEDFEVLQITDPPMDQEGLQAEVIYIDRFGNGITNTKASMVQRGSA